MLGCGSRTKNLYKDQEKTSFNNQANIQENKAFKSEMSSVTDIRNFLLNNGLKVKSNGQKYELKYGDLTFSGSADLEFAEKKEETFIHHVYKVHTTYVTETTYQTKTTYTTDKSSKKIDVERTGVSFVELLGVIVSSLAVGAVLWELVKRLKF